MGGEHVNRINWVEFYENSTYLSALKLKIYTIVNFLNLPVLSWAFKYVNHPVVTQEWE